MYKTSYFPFVTCLSSCHSCILRAGEKKKPVSDCHSELLGCFFSFSPKQGNITIMYYLHFDSGSIKEAVLKELTSLALDVLGLFAVNWALLEVLGHQLTQIGRNFFFPLYVAI